MTRDNPHVPRPLEGVVPNGDLAVVQDRQLSNDSVTVPADDRPLYELLMDILEDAHVRDTMPANLAVACDDLVDVRETVSHPDRGSTQINGPAYGLSYLNEVRRAVERHRDREPVTLVAVGCSGSKYDVNGTVPAADLYKGAYWSCKDDYSATIGDDRRIISAQHAVLAPDREIEHYERVPSDLEGVPVDSDQRLPSGDAVETLLDQWALRVHNGLSAWLDDVAGGIDPRDVTLEVLLGTSYRDPLEQRGVFDALRGPAEVEIAFPFQEVEQAQGGNGNQMGWMTDEVEAAQAIATDGGTQT